MNYCIQDELTLCYYHPRKWLPWIEDATAFTKEEAEAKRREIAYKSNIPLYGLKIVRKTPRSQVP